jgi:hypothetical protein
LAAWYHHHKGSDHNKGGVKTLVLPILHETVYITIIAQTMILGKLSENLSGGRELC